MTDTNLTLTLYGEKDLRLEDKPIPEPESGEVQISVRSVGICGSDIGYWQQGRIGNYVVESPMTMGHEPSGVVTKLGLGVTGVNVGDRVAIEPSKPCSRCTFCKQGRYNVCASLGYLATPPTHGCLARYCCHPADFVHKLPDNVTFDEGALVQPLSLGFYACQRGGVTVGDYVLVSGAGPLGMSVVMAAKARGVAKICVTDIDQSRLDFIKKLGADVTVNIAQDTPLVTSSRVVKGMMGRAPDVALECSGSAAATATAIHSLRPTGVLVQIGFSGATVEIPLVTATLKELDIRGSIRFANCYPTVLEAMSSGRVDVKPLVTHRFDLENAMDAYNAALRREGVKVVIDCTRRGQE